TGSSREITPRRRDGPPPPDRSRGRRRRAPVDGPARVARRPARRSGRIDARADPPGPGREWDARTCLLLHLVPALLVEAGQARLPAPWAVLVGRRLGHPPSHPL